MIQSRQQLPCEDVVLASHSKVSNGFLSSGSQSNLFMSQASDQHHVEDRVLKKETRYARRASDPPTLFTPIGFSPIPGSVLGSDDSIPNSVHQHQEEELSSIITCSSESDWSDNLNVSSLRCVPQLEKKEAHELMDMLDVERDTVKSFDCFPSDPSWMFAM